MIASAIRFCSRHNSTANSIFPVSKDFDRKPDPDSSVQISKGSANLVSTSLCLAIASNASRLVSAKAVETGIILSDEDIKLKDYETVS